MRPVYESPDTLALQRATIEKVEARWSCIATSLKKFSAVDYALCRGPIIRAWAEVKVRTNPAGKYREYMLSLHKWREAVEQSEFTRLPFFLIVGFSDGIRYIKGTRETPVTYAMGGRKDRNDPADMEPVVLIPMRLFSRL